MNPTTGPDSHLRQALERDRLCDRFESELRAGGSPLIEDHLGLVPEAEREDLLRELLRLEVAWAGGPLPASRRDAYLARFATWPGAVESALSEGKESSAESPPHSHDERSRFRILRLHSHGGLGVVYAALDEQLGRVVALKEIQPDLARDENIRKRFAFEARLTSRLEHPGVVPVYAASRRSTGEPYYVSKLVRGASLKEAIQALHSGPVWARHGAERQADLRRLLRRFLVVCETVAYAHSEGVLHRDLKPENILLGDFGETLVIDWGLAKLCAAGPDERGPGNPEGPPELRGLDRGDATAAGSDVGTPIYASPEQALGDSPTVGPASDVYSLGATLYHLLSGRPPYDPHRPPAETRGDVLAGRAVPLRALHWRIPRALEAICRKAMATAPGERYESALALAADVERWLAGEPVEAYPEPVVTRLGRWARRHRVTTGLAAALAAVALVAGLLSWHWTRIATADVNLLLDRLESAEPEQVPFLAEPLVPLAPLAREAIAARLGTAPGPATRQALALALATVDPARADTLARELRSDAALRHRLASALARPGGNGAMGTDRLRRVLTAVRVELLDDLRSLQGRPLEDSAPAQETAGEVLLEFAKDRPDVLAWAFTEAPEAQFPRFLAALRGTPETSRKELRRVLADQGKLDFTRPRDPAWREPGPGAVEAIARAGGFVSPHFLWWQAMPVETFQSVAESLEATGFRPLRVRPFRAAGGALLVASAWVRDGASWALAHDLAREEVLRRDTALQREGYVPADVACHLAADTAETRYAAAWVRPSPALITSWWRRARGYAEHASALIDYPPGRLALGLSVEQARAEALDRDRSALADGTVQFVRHPDGRVDVSQIDQAVVRSPLVFAFTLGTEAQLRERLAHGLVQLDVCVAPGSGTEQGETYLATWQEPGVTRSRTLLGLPPDAHLAAARAMAAEGFLPGSLSLATRADGRVVGASVWTRLSHDRFLTYPTRQRVRAAVALFHLGEPGPMWAMLRHSDDPTERSWLVELLPRLGVPAPTLIERLGSEPDVSARRALLLALGGYERPVGVEPLLERVRSMARNDPDPGLHSAALWLLGRWGPEAEAERLEADLPRGLPVGEDPRRWLVTREGQTLAIVRGPVRFTMGGPHWDTTDEGMMLAHPVRIGRDFAVGVTEVTVAQLARFQEEMEQRGTLPSRSAATHFSRQPQGPALGVDFFLAARYCNWLSAREGLPESQWCFQEQPSGGLDLAPDYLRRTGYRLPTEAEWEYACRAGSVTPRFHGRGSQDFDALLPRYAWCLLGNAHNRAHPVGQLKPNDLGLFDVLGNAHEWCLDAKRPYCEGRCDRERDDVEDAEPLRGDSNRILRGGWFHLPASGLSSGYRSWSWAAYGHHETGFRVARTLPPR